MALKLFDIKSVRYSVLNYIGSANVLTFKPVLAPCRHHSIVASCKNGFNNDRFNAIIII